MKNVAAVTYTHELLQTLTVRELSLISDLEAELGEKLTEEEILDGLFKNGRRRLCQTTNCLR